MKITFIFIIERVKTFWKLNGYYFGFIAFIICTGAAIFDFFTGHNLWGVVVSIVALFNLLVGINYWYWSNTEKKLKRNKRIV